MAQVLFKDDTPPKPPRELGGGIYFFVFKYFYSIFFSDFRNNIRFLFFIIIFLSSPFFGKNFEKTEKKFEKTHFTYFSEICQFLSSIISLKKIYLKNSKKIPFDFLLIGSNEHFQKWFLTSNTCVCASVRSHSLHNTHMKNLNHQRV